MSPVASRRALLRGAIFSAACACVAGGGVRIAYAADAPPKSPPKSSGGKWICPPCGCSQDGKEFTAPGVCPDPGCGMPLIPAPAPKA